MQLQSTILSFLRPSNARDKAIRLNVVNSFIYQFLINLLGLLVVPLSLSYIDKEKYGIWVNASIMVTWVVNMNFGLGFGMQNKVAESLAKDDKAAAQEFVTITYRYCTLIALAILILSIPASYFINWNKVFNSKLPSSELQTVGFIVFISFLGNFVLNNISPLANATQKSSFPKLVGLLSNVSMVVFLFLVQFFSHNNIVLATLILSVPGPVILLFANFYFFKKHFPYLKPKWKIVSKEKVRQTFSLGLKFYIMQLSNLALFSSGTFIVTQYLGPVEVTPFSLVNRYFYFGYFIFSLGITPFWSAFTDAWVKKDFPWIRKTVRQLFIAGGVATLLIGAMTVAAFYVIPVWSRHTFDIGQYHLLIYSSALFTIALIFSNIISYFLSGIGKVNLQMAVQIFISVSAIPLSIFFVNVDRFGSAGVNIAVFICQVIFMIICGWYMWRVLSREMQESG